MKGYRLITNHLLNRNFAFSIDLNSFRYENTPYLLSFIYKRLP